MDSDNNISTSAEQTPKAIEDHETQDPVSCSEDTVSTTKEVLTTQYQAIPANTVTTEQVKIKETIFKNISNDKDPSSEDIELKWDDDSDIDETLLDDTIPGLIESLGVSNTLGTVKDNGGSIKSVNIDEGISKTSEGCDLMDVDTANAEETFNKTDNEAAGDKTDVETSNEEMNACNKDDGFSKVLADSSIEKDLFHANATKEDMDVDTSSLEEGKPQLVVQESSKKIEKLRESSEPDTTVLDTKIQKNNLVQAIDLESSSAEDAQSSISVPVEESDLKLDIDPIVTYGDLTTCNPKDAPTRLALDSVEISCSPKKFFGESCTSVAKDKELIAVDGNKVKLATSDITEIATNTNKEADKKIPAEIISEVEKMEPDTSGVPNVLDISASLVDELDSKNKSDIPEPDPPTESISLAVLKELSDAEDDDLVAPSKEEEEILLAEPDLSTSTESQIEFPITSDSKVLLEVATVKAVPNESSPSELTDNAQKQVNIDSEALELPCGTSEADRIDVKSSEKILKATESSKPVSTMKPEYLKEQLISSDTARIKTDTESMIIDEIPVSHSLGLLAESVTRTDASKKHLDAEVQICNLSDEVKSASKEEPAMAMVTDTTDFVQKTPLYPDTIKSTQLASDTAGNNTNCMQKEPTAKAMITDELDMDIVTPQDSHPVQTEAIITETIPKVKDSPRDSIPTTEQFVAKAMSIDAPMPSKASDLAVQMATNASETVVKASAITEAKNKVVSSALGTVDAVKESDAVKISVSTLETVPDAQETGMITPAASEKINSTPKGQGEISAIAKETCTMTLDTAKIDKTAPDAPETVKTTPDNSKTAKTAPDTLETEKKSPETSETAKTAPEAPGSVKADSITLETAKKGPDALESVTAVPDTSKTVKAPPDTLETVKTTPDTSDNVKAPPDATNPVEPACDTSETVKTRPDATGTVKTGPDASATVKTGPDATETVKLGPDSLETVKTVPDAPETATTSPDISDAAAKAPDASQTNPTELSTVSTSNTQVVDPEILIPAPDLSDTLGLLEELPTAAEDASDEIPEFTDSLGLLAESSRPIDEEEEPEMEEEDDGDDDDDAEDDQDDESNLPTTADQSEDSNAQTSENDAPNQTDIDISEDGFATPGATRMAIAGVVGGTEIVAKNADGAEEMDLDNVFDELVGMLEQEREESTAVGLAKTIEDDKMDVGDEITTGSKDDTSVTVDSIATVPAADGCKAAGTLPPPPAPDKGAGTPGKARTLSRCTDVSMNVVNIVELEESSSEDDVQDTTVDVKADTSTAEANEGDTPQVVGQQEDTVSKPASKTRIRLNTDELTIKTAAAGSEPTLIIPEAKLEDIPNDGKPAVPKFSLEVFSLDSDEDDGGAKEKGIEKKASPVKEKTVSATRCANTHCQGSATVASPPLKLLAKRATLCHTCADLLDQRMLCLMEGVKDTKPLLELDMERPDSDLVEISDSDSDDGADDSALHPKVMLGEAGAKMLEEQLADLINNTWKNYQLDERLATAKDDIELQAAQLWKEQKEIDSMLDECQIATDTLRRELYAAFALPQRQLPTLEICDTQQAQYAKIIDEDASDGEPVRRSKRPRVASKEDHQAKRPAIPLGFTGDDMKQEAIDSSIGDGANKGDDDNTDIKVVALSAELAPTGLPAIGTLQRQPVSPGLNVYAMKHAFGAWQRATVLQVPPRGPQQPFTTCKVRFEHKAKPQAMISARHLAYFEPADVRLTIGTRVIALFSDIVDINKRKSYYSGVVAEMPNPVNSYRYLVFFDDGYAQYVSHADTRVVCECSPLVWEEVHPFSREFVHQYLRAYPERPMVRLHAGQTIKTEWNGKWWVSRVIKVDASLVQVHFEADNRYEWIYRGSTRLAPLYLELQAAERHRARPLPRSTQGKKNMPYVEYTRSEEQESKNAAQLQQQNEELKRQRSVAKKSTTSQVNSAPQHAAPAAPQDAVMSRVVYYTPKSAVKPYKMEPHTCSTKCKRTDVLPLKELRTYNPLARPLLSGWERQLVRHRGRKEVLYRAPCGRRLRSLPELHRYLRATRSDMGVDLFDFSPDTHCLAEFVLNRCLVSKKDLSHGKENVPVPCVNYYDTSLPEFCSYNTERTPTAGVPLNLDPEFLCGCDCEDDCQDKSKCNCWKLTLDGARTVGQDTDDVGYVYKRLLDPVPSGIYECNSRCKCKHTCLNRVAQHPLQLKLQVFKTPNRGWGIRALNDVPKGAFLCVYAGNLLTDATANLDGLNEGDEYLAELDYIEVVEQMKEGYEEDIPDKDKDADSKGSRGSASATSSASSSSEDERQAERDDGEFRPVGHLPPVREFSKRLRRREKKEKDKKETEVQQSPAGEKEKGDCITISDDEEVREPSRFMAQTDMGSNNHISKYRSVRSLYGKDEACYIMDAKVQGNIGRYLNHSCLPNVFVQNVFVDTHDPRFPWVAFFALSHIRAGTELTWNYNYDVGSVPDKILYCYCGAPNCRGRLL